MASGHSAVNIGPIAGAVPSTRQVGPLLIEQETELSAVIDILGRQLRREDLAGPGIHADVQGVSL